MAHVKRSYAATETVVVWTLGTRPGGKYMRPPGSDEPLTENLEDARTFLTDRAAREFLLLGVPKDLVGKLRIIRVSRTTRESCDG